MARADKSKTSIVERDSKFKKLSKMIKSKEKELAIIEAKEERT